MSRTIYFDREYLYNGPPDYHNVNVIIRLLPPGGPPLTVNALLDTGAEFSVFDKSLAQALGVVDISSGRALRLRTADEREYVGYQHNVTIEFLGHRVSVPVAFCPDWPEGIDNLLGMGGFFDRFIVAFDHRARAVYAAVI